LFNFFLLKCGNVVVLEVVSLVNVPGSLVRLKVNCLECDVVVTMYVPLNPRFIVPAVLLVLLTFKISTSEPTERLWGSSVVIVAILELQVAFEINLKFLC